MKKFLNNYKYVLFSFLLFDLVVVALHFVFQGKGFFNLDFESNLPTIYQGSKLMFIAFCSILFLVLGRLGNQRMKKEWFWVFWAAMFFFIAMDEVGQIHENISSHMKDLFGQGAEQYEATLVDAGYESTPWLLYYVGFFIGATAIILYSLKDLFKEFDKKVWILIIGWVLFLGVPVIEYINTMPGIMFQEGYEALMVIEEILEILGGTILLGFTFGAMLQRLIVVEKGRKA